MTKVYRLLPHLEGDVRRRIWEKTPPGESERTTGRRGRFVGLFRGQERGLPNSASRLNRPPLKVLALVWK